jgi:regulator of RNase E activity RraB
MLYGAMRDIVFQVEDVEGFSAAYERWSRSRKPGAWKSELVESDGWSFFDRKLRPGPAHRKWIQNNHVVIQLLQAGSNRQRLHSLDHLFIGESAALDLIARELEELGLEPERQDPTKLKLVQELPLDPDEITTWTSRFEGIARECGASYDGWGSAVLS